MNVDGVHHLRGVVGSGLTKRLQVVDELRQRAHSCAELTLVRVRTEERRQSFRLNAIWPREFRTAEAPPYTDDIHALAMLWDTPMNTRVEDLIFDVVQGLTTELDRFQDVQHRIENGFVLPLRDVQNLL